MKAKEIFIPTSVLEKNPENNGFTLLRFFVQIFGPEKARTILELLADDPNESDFLEANKELFEALRTIFPYFRNLEDVQVKMVLIEMYHKANEIVSGLIESSYPGMEYEVGLLNTTSVPTTDIAKRISLIMSNGDSTPRYKYELVRQDVLTLMLMELSKYNHTVPNSENLHTLQAGFEEDLYEGKRGDIYPTEFYSLHSENDNSCLGTFQTKEAAELFIKNKKLFGLAHIKHHRWQVRSVDEVGQVLANMRIKSDFSIVRKMIYNATYDQSRRPKIKIGRDRDLLDTTGFMFVVPEGQRKTMLAKIMLSISARFPEIRFVEKHKVGEKRGQSSKVSFLRILAYLGDDERPIEVMVMDRQGYLNYLYELEQAHEIFGLRKSDASAEQLFPEDVYHYQSRDVQEHRIKRKNEIEEKLLRQSRVKS